MYAVIETGGKQYRVAPGESVQVELLEAEPGKEIIFDQVLMVSGDECVVGAPRVEGAKVIAELVEHGKGDKVIIFKYKRRKHYQRKRGHRQNYSEVRIKEIMVGDKALTETKAKDAPAKEPAKPAEPAAPAE